MTKRTQFDAYYQDYVQPKNNDFQRLQNWYYAWLKLIEKKVKINKYKSKKVIELGGGIGAFCKLLENDGFTDVTNNDVSAKVLGLAKKFNSDLKIACFDVEKMTVNNRYDLIFAFEVLEHFDRPEATLKKIYQTLKKDGLFIGSTPYPFPKGFNDPTHQHVLKPTVWKNYFRKAGFKEISIQAASFMPLLYRFNKHLNFCLPFYIKNQYFVSTTLIWAKKK